MLHMTDCLVPHVKIAQIRPSFIEGTHGYRRQHGAQIGRGDRSYLPSREVSRQFLRIYLSTPSYASNATANCAKSAPIAGLYVDRTTFEVFLIQGKSIR